MTVEGRVLSFTDAKGNKTTLVHVMQREMRISKKTKMVKKPFTSTTAEVI